MESPEEQEDAYDTFAPFYQALTSSTDRTVAENHVLTSLVTDLRLPRDARVLDFACGCGDQLAALHNLGFGAIEGTDGSLGMVRQAQHVYPFLKLHHVPWNQLCSYFEEREPYDLLYALSCSLPHARSDELPTILHGLRSGLRSGGTLIFDVRRLSMNVAGQVREPNRAVGVFRELAEVARGSDTLVFEDKCDYTADRQIITYRITSSSRVESPVCFSVTYALKTHEYYEGILRAVGFETVRTQARNAWPYWIICAN